MAPTLQAVVSLNTSAFTSGMSSISQLTSNLTGAMSIAFGGVTAEILAMGSAFGPVGVAVGLLKEVVAVGKGIEDTMAEIAAVTGRSTDAVAEFGTIADDVTGSTRFRMDQVAEAMARLAAAGFESSDAMRAALKPSLDLAAAGGTNTALAVDTMVSALRAFNLDATQATHVANLFAGGAAVGLSSVESLAEAFKYAAPAASAFGLSLEETVGTLALFEDRGMRGSMAGTAFAQAMRAMTEAANESKGAIGAALAGWDPATEGLVGAIARLEGAGITAKQALEELGDRGGRAVATLMTAGAEAIANYSTSVSTLGDVTLMAATRQDTLKGQFQDLIGEMQRVANAIYGQIVPALSSMLGKTIEMVQAIPQFAGQVRDLAVNGIRSLVDAFHSLTPSAQLLIVGFGGVGAAIGLLLPVVTSLVSGLVSGAIAMTQAMVGFFVPVLAGIAAVTIAFATFSLGEVIANTKVGTDTIRGHLTSFFTWLIVEWTSSIDALTTSWQMLMRRIEIFVLERAPDVVAAFAEMLAPIIEHFGKFRAWVLDHLGMNEAATQVREAASTMAAAMRDFDAGVSLEAARAELQTLEQRMAEISDARAVQLKMAFEQAGQAAEENMRKGIAPAEIFDSWLQQMDQNGGALWQTLVTGGEQAMAIFTGLRERAGLTSAGIAEVGTVAGTSMAELTTSAEKASGTVKSLGAAFAQIGKVVLDVKLPFVSEDVATRWVTVLNDIAKAAMDIKIDLNLPFISEDQSKRWLTFLNDLKSGSKDLKIDIGIPHLSEQQADRWIKFLGDLKNLQTSISIAVDLPHISQELADRYIELFQALGGVGNIDLGKIGDVPDFHGTLQSIDDSLKSLIQMKGIVWA